MKVRAQIDRKTYWWGVNGWVAEPENALELCRADAEQRIRITNINNRFLDSEDQVEAEIEESK
ncbi:MAG: hypothetical protein ACRCZI_09775 [Cetobacterium sp.]